MKTEFEQYCIDNWSDCLKPISELSNALVDSKTVGYCFDDVCSNLCSDSSSKPASVDAMFIKGNVIEFVEYKTGIRQKITTSNFDDKLIPVSLTQTEKDEYKEMLIERSEFSHKYLLECIKLKAVESYVLFEKKVILDSHLQFDRDKFFIRLIIVHDDGGISSNIDILGSLSKGHQQSELSRTISSSLCRYRKQEDANSNKYYYDDIKVVSAIEYKNRI